MVTLKERIFLRLQYARAYKEKFLIGTAATVADSEITFEDIQNIIEMEQTVFKNPLETILTGDDKSEHYGN